MNTQQHQEERLWEYIDGSCSSEERSVIEQLISTDAAWRVKYRELLDVQQLLSSAELEEPSLRFTRNVMEEIARLHIAPATRSYINNRIVWGIALFFITLVVTFLIYGFSQIDWAASGDSSIPVNFSKVDFSKMFSNDWINAFLMINVVLGLFLLDRFLANKRKRFSDQNW